MREHLNRTQRDPHEGDVAFLAAAAFNVMHDNPDYPRYLMGRLVLPPRGIKDPEGVGRSAQTCTVLSCQPKALEIAFADPNKPQFDPATAKRFLLRPDTMFRITPGSIYRLQNHSTTHEAKVTFTVIRETEPDGVVQDAGLDGEEADDSDASTVYDDESTAESAPGGTPGSQRKRQRVQSFSNDDSNIASNSAGGMDDVGSHQFNDALQLASPLTSRRSPAASQQVLELRDRLAAAQAETECIRKIMHKYVAKLGKANGTIKEQATELQKRDAKLAKFLALANDD
jgi:hypothetical protein